MSGTVGTTSFTSTNASTLPKRKAPGKSFTGRLQPVCSRVPAVADVNFAKGGSDFRCPNNTSSLGKQVLSGSHRRSEAGIRFAEGSRFKSAATIGIGPAAQGQISSMKRQALSNRRSAASTSFGTSDRDGAWKLYAVYTDKRF